MLRRGLTVVFRCLSLVVLFVVGGGFLLYTTLTHAETIQTPVEFQELAPYVWARIDLSDQTQCSDGSDYRIYARRGESDNLLVHFVGGGAAWDAETSSNPITIDDMGDGFYFATIWDIVRVMLDGIFSTSNPDNPFHDWNVVYIPYCTADLHIGDAHLDYTLSDGKTFTLHHNGHQNITESLDWVFGTFESPEKLLISGESAGAFGSLFWTPTIAARYPDSEIYHLGDGSYLETPQWSHIVNQVWQADTEKLGFEVRDDLIGGLYLQYAQTTAPTVTYLHLNTLYDETLMYFNAYLNDDFDVPDYYKVWSAGMRASMQAVDDSDLPYYYFLTDHNFSPEKLTTPHTSISFGLFYEMEEGGVRLSDWLRRIIIDGERFSVGSEFMP